MNLKTIHTEIGNKWIRINGISPNLKKVLHDFEGENLIGYVYIDHDAGLTLEVVKLFDDQNGALVFRNSPADQNIRVISRLDATIKSEEISVLSEAFIKEFNLEIPQYLNSYERADLNEFRLNEKFHEFRGDGLPDDLQILLPPINGLKPELMWGRVEKLDGDNLTCRLLNKPHQNFGIKINEKVNASIRNMDGKAYVVCDIKLNEEMNSAKDEKKPWWKFW